MLLSDIRPTPMRDPFAPGALLPETLTTRNSRYDIREHALRIGQPAAVTVTCVVGTLAGMSWTADRSDVHLSPYGLTIDGVMGTTKVQTVNGYPVSTWGF